MNLKIYKNYGCLSAEKRIIYTCGMPQPTAKCSDEIIVKLPDGWDAYGSVADETILTAPWGEHYTVHQVLDGAEYPYFKAYEHRDRVRLEEVM